MSAFRREVRNCPSCNISMPQPVKGLRLTVTQAARRVKTPPRRPPHAPVGEIVLDLLPPLGQNDVSIVILAVSIFQSETGVLNGWLK
jgi:hypothetical protein